MIAKLERLSRNVAFIMTLRESGVPFIAADMPEANTMTIGIMAVMAQAEREAINTRTKSGARRDLRGSAAENTRRGTKAAKEKAAHAKRVKALAFYNSSAVVAKAFRSEGWS